MKTKVLYTASAKGFIFLSAFSLVYVATLAIWSPQAVMDLVKVKLDNTDAISSIRGVYGGVGVTLFAALLYLGLYEVEKGLAFLSIFWGSYSLSRILTLVLDGSLGAFGTQWLWIETIFCVIGLSLLIFGKKIKSQVHA
jgi:hypothetical protein